MKMFFGLVLFAAFALPAAFAAYQDVITLQTYEVLLKNGAANGMTKTVISNPALEEALFSYAKEKLGGNPGACGETCLFGKCYTASIGCSCNKYRVCTKNSLEEPLVASAKKGYLGAFAAHGDVITLQTYEELLKNGDANGMTKTVISNPVLEEALVSYGNEKLGGSPLACGETCLWGKCYSASIGCSCNSYRVCTKNSLAM